MLGVVALLIAMSPKHINITMSKICITNIIAKRILIRKKFFLVVSKYGFNNLRWIREWTKKNSIKLRLAVNILTSTILIFYP